MALEVYSRLVVIDLYWASIAAELQQHQGLFAGRFPASVHRLMGILAVEKQGRAGNLGVGHGVPGGASGASHSSMVTRLRPLLLL